MSADQLTDPIIEALLEMRKYADGPSRRPKEKPGHIQTDTPLRGEDGTRFCLYTRQSQKLQDDFSCGLRLERPGAEPITLVRYNGASHAHRNHLEGTRFVGQHHIHRATERYIAAGHEPEGFAQPTDRYTTLDGALWHLVRDCNIAGIPTTPEQPSLLP